MIASGAPMPALAQATKAPKPAQSVAVEAKPIAKGLAHPWAVQFLPDGRFLVTERPGRLRIVSREGRLSQPVSGLPAIDAGGQGGLLDVGVASGVVNKSGAWFTFGETRLGQGREQAKEFLIANPDIADEVESAIRARVATIAVPVEGITEAE